MQRDDVITVANALMGEIEALKEKMSPLEEPARLADLYDLEKLMDTTHGLEALKDKELYQIIVAHRSKFNALKGIDYANHHPKEITIVPPDNVIKGWEKDYKTMQESMFYGVTIDFEKLMMRISELNTKVNRMNDFF